MLILFQSKSNLNLGVIIIISISNIVLLLYNFTLLKKYNLTTSCNILDSKSSQLYHLSSNAINGTGIDIYCALWLPPVDRNAQAKCQNRCRLV